MVLACVSLFCGRLSPCGLSPCGRLSPCGLSGLPCPGRLFPFRIPPPCLLYWALKTAVIFFFLGFGASSTGFSAFTGSSFGVSLTGSSLSGAAFWNFFRTISCAASSTLLCAAFTAYSVFANVSIISFELISNSFASS